MLLLPGALVPRVWHTKRDDTVVTFVLEWVYLVTLCLLFYYRVHSADTVVTCVLVSCFHGYIAFVVLSQVVRVLGVWNTSGVDTVVTCVWCFRGYIAFVVVFPQAVRVLGVWSTNSVDRVVT